MARSQSQQSKSSGSSGGGCASVFALLLIIGLAIKFWYIACMLLFFVAVSIYRARYRERKAKRHRAGPADPWLNEVSVALADLGLAEFSRNHTGAIGGVPVLGNIVVRNRYLAVDIAMLGSAQATHRAKIALRTNSITRDDLTRGRRAFIARDGVAFFASGRRGVVDEALLDEVVRVVDRLPVDILAAPSPTPAAALRPSSPGANPVSEDAIKRLRQLSELHRDGTLTDDEFAEKKAALLKRI